MGDIRAVCPRLYVMIKVRIIRNIVSLLLVLVLMGGISASAQRSENVITRDNGNLVKTEMGIGIGGVYTMLQPQSADVALKPKLGYHGNVQMALVFGKTVGVQTEICYSGGSVDASLRDMDFKRTVRTTTIDIPIFLSLRLLNIVRLNLGPQFTVMNRAEYSVNGETYFFGPLYPTCNLAGGLGLKLFGNLMLEVRYVYPLGVGTNQFMGHEFETTSSRVAAGLTLVF